MIRLILALLLFTPWPALAEVFRFPAPSGATGAEMTIYSTLDERLASPLIAAFQDQNPDVAVIYEDLLADQIRARVIDESTAGGPTADFLFSSAMDLQMKLANDGYARPVRLPEAANWPGWANWRDTAYAMTFEPAVLVYHRPSFPNGPPQSRLALLEWLRESPAQSTPRIGTYDITRSAVGYLYMARDEEHFPDIWALLRAMTDAGLETYPTSQDIIDRVADGRLLIGYNILGSYAADQARSLPDLGLVLLRDYTVVISRVAMVPRAAKNPELGERFLAFLMSRDGQELLARKLRLPAVSLEVADADSARAMQAALGAQLRPVPVSPGLMVYLDQAKRRRLLARWDQATSPP